jgi:hypothetical protein
VREVNSPENQPNSRRIKSNTNFIGVPPNMTESTHKSIEGGEFVDEEEEEEA